MATVINAIGVRAFDFVDKDSGNQVKGLSVFHTVLGDSMRGEFGQVPNKITLPFEQLASLSLLNYPCKLSLVTEERLGSKGVYTKIIGVEVVK